MKKANFKTSHAASLHLYNIYILKITLTEVGNRLVVPGVGDSGKKGKKNGVIKDHRIVHAYCKL